jgi:hypothetical protein
MRILFILFLTGLKLNAQNATRAEIDSIKTAKDSAKTIRYLSRAGFNRLINKEFGTVATGQFNNTALASYASFDPANGSFAFKGVVPIGADTNRLSFLAMRIDGDLISDSYTALFNNSALNTNASVRGEYYIRLSKAAIRNFGSEKASVVFRKEIAEQEHLLGLKKIDIEMDPVYLTDQLTLIDAKKTVSTSDSLTAINEYNSYKDSLRRNLPHRNYARLKHVTDTLEKLQAKLHEYKKNYLKLQAKTDSITSLQSQRRNLRNYERNRLDRILKDTIAAIEKNALVTRVRFDWLTIIGAIGKKSFYTFDAGLPFGQQLEKKEKGTFSFGFAWNYYWHSYTRNKAFYANAGVLRMRDNNTSYLSTLEVKQEREFSSGDTTRKISKTYNAFTDPVTEFQQWSIFANVFYLFTGRPSGFHFYPSVDIRDDKHTLSHLGIGYTVSFINEKKDEPVINAEGYIQFIDLFNQLEQKARFWNRNEIGIRFTLPLNFYTGKININEKESR